MRLQPLMAPQHEAEHGREHEKERKDRDKRVVGHQRREIAGLVVAEFHTDGEWVRHEALLEPVDSLLEPVDAAAEPIHYLHGGNLPIVTFSQSPGVLAVNL